MKHLFQFHPELLRIFGSFEAERPAQHVFLEYENRTLLNEIQERKRQQQRRFDENLLWHILYNLLKGAFSVQDINAGQISDILPYNKYCLKNQLTFGLRQKIKNYQYITFNSSFQLQQKLYQLFIYTNIILLIFVNLSNYF
ncbi:hypothetical protein PPERSA_03955 [Pseudocohnilembus persalinus]|uniref:Transmembrane protein n=1 Tax=Pseudocohnilembus persalinus TaxID=266149 RepID=A0A0V0QAP7_PSEPJ|nr:hypothetical protein PPERSA_03955 [Pseudocohnilembus persalinus]|eukprot:KRW99249.1 hypothetical protein PPERSA_03955 [Pseudocohnilembus persalinus]